MHRFRLHSQLFIWVALLATLLASLAPLASQAGSDKAGFWIEVCTAQGSKRVAAGAEQAGGAPASSHLLAHCPCCVGHAVALGLPPPADMSARLLDLNDEYPPAFLAAPRTLHAWTKAQPRGPPRSS